MCGTRDAGLVKECIAANYGMIEMIDDAVGPIMAAIDRLGQDEDTIVVFTSDHGDMMGDHGLLLKGYLHFKGTLQPPLVILDPTRSPQRTSSLVSSLDLGPTLLDLAGLAPYDGIQGRSVVPILDDASASVRDVVLIEDDMPTLLAGFAGVPAKTRTVVDVDGSKYTRHSTGEDMLFDLTVDPDEVQPLSGRDPARRAAMMERLAGRVDRHRRRRPRCPRHGLSEAHPPAPPAIMPLGPGRCVARCPDGPLRVHGRQSPELGRSCPTPRKPRHGISPRPLPQ